MIKKRLLIIDDEENMRHMLNSMLKRHGYEIFLSENGLTATELLISEVFDFVLCDVRMPEMDGLEFLRCNKKRLQSSTVIMMSAYGSIETAIEAMKYGAYDFISKPFKTDEVLLTLKKAEEREQLRSENRLLRSELKKQGVKKGFDAVVGSSKKLKDVIDISQKVGQYNTTVLIHGGSGTGKELIAKGVHECSPRRYKHFYAVNCGTIPGDLLESELFGYFKGAFTGAETNKKGIFEEADGSTLFLDEIAELPMDMQVKLLRVLQENEIRPVGSTKTKKIDVRVIAATAKNLESLVANGEFREDLFYRLNVFKVDLPSLQERIEDIGELVDHFIDKYNKKLGRNIEGISDETLKRLREHSWPGNIRELENIIQRCMVLTDGPIIDEVHLPSNHVQVDSTKANNLDYPGFSLKEAQKELESAMIKKALDETSGNKSKASILLGISYPSLLSKIKEYMI